ncbi:hypothetical protein B0H17DRAFT_1331994 [Mycena rosella]|uniref:Uncharacterized protein n=1 Tax=Mycena rosella TaxID=1033263 RepID=A0AAD7DDM7_MYCRO|nr:hypothetical protein B0H17DRAFT_1331994 [Mycena rosella]
MSASGACVRLSMSLTSYTSSSVSRSSPNAFPSASVSVSVSASKRRYAGATMRTRPEAGDGVRECGFRGAATCGVRRDCRSASGQRVALARPLPAAAGYKIQCWAQGTNARLVRRVAVCGEGASWRKYPCALGYKSELQRAYDLPPYTIAIASLTPPHRHRSRLRSLLSATAPVHTPARSNAPLTRASRVRRMPRLECRGYASSASVHIRLSCAPRSTLKNTSASASEHRYAACERDAGENAHAPDPSLEERPEGTTHLG